MRLTLLGSILSLAFGVISQDAGKSATSSDPKAAPTVLKIETTFMPEDCPHKARTGDTIQVHYTGTLFANGEKFDSSLDRDPFSLTLGVGQVISGWDEGLQGVCLGEKRILTIPSDKAYGPGGRGRIPPNSALVFDVELVGLQPQPSSEDDKPPPPPDAKESPTVLKIETTFMPDDCPHKARTGDTIQVHYTGTLFADGKKFDSSLNRGEPISLTLGAGQVISGWDEGLQGMCVREKRILTIPSDKAYGPRGRGRVIPPNSALVFTVELMGIQPAPPSGVLDRKSVV